MYNNYVLIEMDYFLQIINFSIKIIGNNATLKKIYLAGNHFLITTHIKFKVSELALSNAEN